MDICINHPVATKEPAFVELKKQYENAGTHYDDDYLLSALQAYRKARGRNADWFPASPQQRGALTRFITHDFDNIKVGEYNKKLAEGAIKEDALYSMYDKLYTTLSPAQLRARLDLLISTFSSILDNYIKKNYPGGIDRQTALRNIGDNPYQYIMSLVFDDMKKKTNPQAWINRYKRLHPNATQAELDKYSKWVNDYVVGQFQFILDNKETFATLAAPRIGENEGFFVRIDNFNISFVEAKDTDEDLDSDEVDEDGTDKEEGSKGERYGDFRVVKLMQSLSPRAKRYISNIEMLDVHGNVIRTDLSSKRMLDARQVAIRLQDLLVGVDPEHMMSVLEDSVGRFPWLRGLVDKLNKNPDDQALIYCSFHTQEQRYVYSKVEKGRWNAKGELQYITRIGNTKAAGHALMREAGNNVRGGFVDDTEYEGRSFPMILQNERKKIYLPDKSKPTQPIKLSYNIVDGSGLVMPLEHLQKIADDFDTIEDYFTQCIDWIRMVDGDKHLNERSTEEKIKYGKDQYGEDWSFLRLDGPEAMKAALDYHADYIEKLTRMLHGMGFDLSVQDIRDSAMQTMTKRSFAILKHCTQKRAADYKDGRNKLSSIVFGIDGILGSAMTASKRHATGHYVYSVAGRSFQTINDAVALSQYNELESRFLDEGVSYATHVNINLLHQTFDILNNQQKVSPEEYKENLQNNFLKYEGFTLDDKPIGFIDSAMDYVAKRDQEDGLLEDGSLTGLFQVYNMASANHVKYKDLSKEQKLTNSIVQFFGAEKMFGHNAVEVPIQADYESAYDFVTVPTYGCGRTENGSLAQSSIVNQLVDEVLAEKERIVAIYNRKEQTDRAVLSVYEENGLKFQIFPEFNDAEYFIDPLCKLLKSDETTMDDVRAFVADKVAEQLEKVLDEDFRFIEETGVLTNEKFKRMYDNDTGFYGGFSLYSKTGHIQDLEDKNARAALEYMCLNIFYAREQILKLTVGDLSQFKGLLDYEKRNMMVHSPHGSLYTKATWHGKPVGGTTQNVVYIEDDESQSAFLDDIKELLEQLKDAKVITPEQYDIMWHEYTKITTTDGQAFRTMESYRENMIQGAEWTEEMERVYQKIIKKEKISQQDLNVFFQVQKMVYTGYQDVPAAAGEGQKPVRATVYHKYSEAVLLPVFLAKYCLQAKSVPMQALSGAQEELAKQGKRIDMFLFHSGCKVGSFSILDPFAKDDGNRLRPGVEELKNYIVEKVTNDKYAIHTLDKKYFGKAASTTPHMDDNIAWAAQAEKAVMANIESGDKIKLGGKKIEATEGRDLLAQIKAATMLETFQHLREQFSDPAEIGNLLKEELASKSYASPELMWTLSRVKDALLAGSAKMLIPLYSPGVEHQVQELFASIIKKKLTKDKHDGANILQVTSLGMDIEASMFDNNNALSEKEKMKIVFEGKGKKKRIKYVEVYLPLTDRRLLRYADANGTISPERLSQLVEEGVIPKEIRYFIAYRTPSDAEHSVIPCRVKGFIANTGGATIMLPKEIMKMTGHDYDGDKLRCHFQDFKEIVDENQLRQDYEKERPDDKLLSAIFGYNPDLTYEAFRREMLNPRRKESRKYVHLEYEQYDYDKSPLENSAMARANARVQIIFAEQTSPAGSRRMVMPGGCDQSKVYAKSIELMRESSTDTGRQSIARALVKNEVQCTIQGVKMKLTDENVAVALASPNTLYSILTQQSAKKVGDILSDAMGTVTPFSLKHSIDSFMSIMGGADMIGIYAMYVSALSQGQRLNIHYVPAMTNPDPSKQPNAVPKPYAVKLFGHVWDKIFAVRDANGNYALHTLARLLNAAVDNNKDPILGYINQCPQLAAMTFLMVSAGMSEEQIHLIFNQPAVIELASRLRTRGAGSFRDELGALVSELLTGTHNVINDYDVGEYGALMAMNDKTEEDFINYLPLSLSDVKTGQDVDARLFQAQVLMMLRHLNNAAQNLSDFVRITRPDSSKGAFSSTLSDLLAKKYELDKFRDKLMRLDDEDLHFSGFGEVVMEQDVHEGWDAQYVFNKLKASPVPDIVILNSLILDTAPELFEKYFPQAKESWYNEIMSIAQMYGYRKVQDKLVDSIGKEMLMWKLLGDKRFVTGDPQVEQKRVIVDVPHEVHVFKRRITQAISARDSYERAIAEGKKVMYEPDELGLELENNVFLRCLSLSEKLPVSGDDTPRLQFRLQGVPIEGSTDVIRQSWGDLYRLGEKYNDDRLKQLSTDLFKYCVYTSGFKYGMYEFAHFAPFSIMRRVPGYLEAARDIINSDWSDPVDAENFRNQYIMNHWGDNSFLWHIYWSALLKNAPQADKQEDGSVDWLIHDNGELDPRKVDPAIRALRRSTWGEDSPGYIVVTDKITTNSGRTIKEQILYRVTQEGINFRLTRAEKLGVRNRNQQIIYQYNPTEWYAEVKPVVPGNDSAWGQLNREIQWGPVNIDNPPVDDPGVLDSLVNEGNGRVGQGGVMLRALVAERARHESRVVKAEEVVEKAQENPATQHAASQTDEQVGQQVQSSEQAEEAQQDTSNQSADADMLTAVFSNNDNGLMFQLCVEDEKGNFKTESVPATPRNIAEARRQKAFIELNKKLREILREKGVAIGTLEAVEGMLEANGVTIFDTANVTAEGLVELIYLAKGYRGEMALPEEFAHVALAMLGKDNALVQRLVAVLKENDAAMKEAFGDDYNAYLEAYKNDMDKMAVEAAGKLVAKHLLQEQEIQSNSARSLVHRICEKIKEFFRSLDKRRIQNAIFDANNISSTIARGLLGGTLLDEMSRDKIDMQGTYLQAKKQQKDLTEKHDVLTKLLKVETKRLSILTARSEEPNKSASVQATQVQIAKLERAIQNYKTEDAVITYMNDSLAFLTATEQSMLNSINAGLPANRVCRKLNAVRETIYSFSEALDAVNDAVTDKEINDTAGLQASMATMSGILSRFYNEYERYARQFLEAMLASVYGENGLTIDVGKDKGRHISIHEMATKADHDISFAARWFNSLADCPDYVLVAVDDMVRNAKIRSRSRMERVRPRIEKAVADLIRETGSRNQDFMFKWTIDEEGNRHKTRFYISEMESRSLSPAQKAFYDTMMSIKKEADNCLPVTQIEQNKIVMLRKFTTEKLREANGLGEHATVLWDDLKNSVLETSEDFDPENKDVKVDFENNRVDKLTAFFTQKGENESYDDMTDDVAMSIMVYAGMAFEYDALNDIIPIIENAKYMAGEREVQQKSGSRRQRENISTDTYTWKRPFTKRAASLHAQQALNDYLSMHVYGHKAADEGTFGKTPISKRKVTNVLNSVVSASQMAINLPQRISNVLTGKALIFVETAGKGVYNAKDVLWAAGIWAKESVNRMAETGATDVANKLSLWDEHYDIHQNNGRGETHYARGRLSRIFNTHLLYAGLTIGEDYLSNITALAAARNFKMRTPEGKESNLWEAYEVKYLDEASKTGAYLKLKDGWTKADGTPLTAEDEKRFQKQVVSLNFDLQGIYNLDDRSAIQQYAFGSLIIMYRKWIAPAWKRRYGETRYNAMRGSYQEGYYTTWWHLFTQSFEDMKEEVTEDEGAQALWNIVEDFKAFRNAWAINKSKLTPYELSNLKRAYTEMGMVAMLWLATSLMLHLGPGDDDDENPMSWTDKLVLSQLLRLRTELSSQAPTPLLVQEALKIIGSPMAAIGPIKAALNIFKILFPSSWTTIKSGRYKGHTKAYKYFREFPIISMFKKVDNFIDPTPLIAYYSSDNIE